MAQQPNRPSRQSNRRPAQNRRPADPRQKSAQRRRARQRKQPSALSRLFSRPAAEFRPDAQGGGLLKTLHMSDLQRRQYLKWLLYALSMVVLLVIQDVVMSRIHIFGATTDLMACVILLITVMEGTEVGSLYVIIASVLYYFSGSAPGPASIMLLTCFGVGGCMFRQKMLHRSRGAIVFTAGVCLMAYEIGVFGVALFSGLTRWDRLGIFLLTGLLSWAVMIPLYSLIHRIGLMGGTTWKE